MTLRTSRKIARRRRPALGPWTGRVLVLLLALGIARLPAPLRAQTARSTADDGAGAQGVAGRWILVVEGGPVPAVRGELRLVAGEGGTLGGTLALETRDSAPLPLADVRASAGGDLEFLVPGDPPLRFVGRREGDGLAGDAFGGGGEARRWTAVRLAPGAEFYAALPRFLLREIVAGRRDSASALPGVWLAAARAAGETPAAVITAYARAARAAGLAPVAPDTLAHDGLTYLMGGWRRGELVAASRRTLAAIDAQIPDPATRARFAALFRPRGAWIVDLHDAALLAARRRIPSASWAGAAPALAAAGWLPGAPGGDARAARADSGQVPLALYRLAVFARQDTAGAARLFADMRRADPAGAAMVAALLAGYDDGAAWYGETMRFFLDAPWLAGAPGGPARGRSLGDLVRAFWADTTLRPPLIRPVFFGYPQGMPRFGVPDAVVDRLVVPENDAAHAWLARHGRAGLLATLQRLGPPQGDSLGAEATIDAGGELLRLTSVRRQARESANGFLEPADAVALDPSYMPLLALGTVVHEWQHLVFERRRHAAAAGDTLAAPVTEADGIVTLRGSDPVIAEGAAEWSTEALLQPAVARFPLVALGERAKRARMAHAEPDDEHLLGYLLVRTLAGALDDRAATLAALLAASADARRVPTTPALAARWRAFAAAPGRALARPNRRLLVPETRFTIEDNFPDLVSTRIRLPH